MNSIVPVVHIATQKQNSTRGIQILVLPKDSSIKSFQLSLLVTNPLCSQLMESVVGLSHATQAILVIPGYCFEDCCLQKHFQYGSRMPGSFWN